MDITENSINREFGNMDIMLIDHILKGHFRNVKSVLDAGCGEGRNLDYFVRNNMEVYAVDTSNLALKMIRIAYRIPPERTLQSDILNLPFPENYFDAVLCLSVLHFAESRIEFLRRFEKLKSILKMEGLLFLSMNSVIGNTGSVTPAGGGRYFFPDGSTRFLLTEPLMDELVNNDELQWIEKPRTLVIHQQESITYMLGRKKSADRNGPGNRVHQH